MGIFGGTKSRADLLAEVDRAAATLRGGAATAKGMSNLTKFGLLFVLAVVGALVAASWAGAFKTLPGAHSVTVTAPHTNVPPVVLPKVDGTTQAELAVLAAGSGWDAGWKAAALWLADRLLWPSFFGLFVAAGFYALPFIPNELAWRVGVGCVVLMVIGIVAPLAADLIGAIMAARDTVLVHGIPPAAGR